MYIYIYFIVLRPIKHIFHLHALSTSTAPHLSCRSSLVTVWSSSLTRIVLAFWRLMMGMGFHWWIVGSKMGPMFTSFSIPLMMGPPIISSSLRLILSLGRPTSLAKQNGRKNWKLPNLFASSPFFFLLLLS